jgi:hypothetical protein
MTVAVDAPDSNSALTRLDLGLADGARTIAGRYAHASCCAIMRRSIRPMDSPPAPFYARRLRAKRSFMFRLTFRFLGLLFLAGAFAALVIDGTRSIAGGAPSLTPLEQTLLWLMPQKFSMLKTAVRHALPPFLWNHVAVHVLLMPTWVVVGVIGILLMLLTRKRRPKIGYAER